MLNSIVPYFFFFADHFVIVSDMNAVPSGSIVSSPVSLGPFPYEEPRPTLLQISNIEHPQINTYEAFSNSICEVDDVNSDIITNSVNRMHKSCICQIYSNEGAIYDYSDPSVNDNDSEEPCAQSEEPITVNSSKSVVPGPRASNEMRSSSFKNASITSDEEGHKKSEIQKFNDYTQIKV